MAGDEWSKEDRERLVRVEQQLGSLKEYVETRLEAIEKSTESAATSLEKRLDSMNEFRQQLKDQANTMLARAEFQVQHERVCEDVKGLRESRAELSGKADQSSVNWATAMAVVAIVIAAVAVVAGFMGG